jgi:hypothetical protein
VSVDWAVEPEAAERDEPVDSSDERSRDLRSTFLIAPSGWVGSAGWDASAGLLSRFCLFVGSSRIYSYCCRHPYYCRYPYCCHNGHPLLLEVHHHCSSVKWGGEINPDTFLNLAALQSNSILIRNIIFANWSLASVCLFADISHFYKS